MLGPVLAVTVLAEVLEPDLDLRSALGLAVVLAEVAHQLPFAVGGVLADQPRFVVHALGVQVVEAEVGVLGDVLLDGVPHVALDRAGVEHEGERLSQLPIGATKAVACQAQLLQPLLLQSS